MLDLPHVAYVRDSSGTVVEATILGRAHLSAPKAWSVDPETLFEILPPLDVRGWACVVPPPPPLSGDDDSALVRSMSRAWARVVDRFATAPRKSRRYRTVIARKHRHFADVVRTIRECVRRGISGEAYQLAAFRAWPDSLGQERPHPFAWSMVPKCRVRFLEDASGISLGGRLVATPSFRELVHRHHHAMARFVRERLDEPALRAVVTQFFPGDSFRRLRAAAVREASEAEARIRKEIDDGGWPW